MTNYYQNTEFTSCSDLKKVMRKHLGQPEPNWAAPAISFGTEVDEILTDMDQTKAYSAKAFLTADLYKKKTCTPYNTQHVKPQWEFYRTIAPFGEPVKMRGRTDLWYPKFSILEDIKTTSLPTKSWNSINNLINRFDWEMQMVIYMHLSRSKTGVISILSHTKQWLHQVDVTEGNEMWNRGFAKLKNHLKVWKNTQS